MFQPGCFRRGVALGYYRDDECFIYALFPFLSSVLGVDLARRKIAAEDSIPETRSWTIRHALSAGGCAGETIKSP